MRYLKDGEPVNTFVGLRPCPNAKAMGITEAVNSAMSDVCDNWKEKVVALGTDGAAVMVGEVGGVFALLKRDIPHLIKVHCIAQRLELAFADTVKAIGQNGYCSRDIYLQFKRSLRSVIFCVVIQKRSGRTNFIGCQDAHCPP